MHVFAFLGFSNFGIFNRQFFAYLVFSNFSIFSSLGFAFLGFSNFNIFSSQVLAILAAMAILAARFWHFQVLCNFFAYVFAQLSFFLLIFNPFFDFSNLPFSCSTQSLLFYFFHLHSSEANGDGRAKWLPLSACVTFVHE